MQTYRSNEKIEEVIIDIQVGTDRLNRSLSADLQIDEDRINKWLIEIPSKTAYWGVWSKRAKMERLKAEYNKETALVQCKAMARSILNSARKEEIEAYAKSDAASKKLLAKPKDGVTETEITDLAKSLPAYQESIRLYLAAREADEMLDAAMDAFKICHGALMTLAANMRTEYKSYGNSLSYERSDVNVATQDTLRKSATNAMQYATKNVVPGRTRTADDE